MEGEFIEDDITDDEFVDESEVDDIEDVYDSDCDHSDIEYDNEQPDSDVEHTDNEYNGDEYGDESDVDLYNSDHESSQGEQDGSSQVESDCEENEHECSSGSDSNEELVFTEQDAISPLRESLPPIPTPLQNGTTTNSTPGRRQMSQPELSRNKPVERNNNRVLQPCNSVEIIGELRSAIDARVRRSASCREVSTQLKLSGSSLDDTSHIINAKERVKDRRARLRTLELKREQILDEVRDGAKDRVIDAMYR